MDDVSLFFDQFHFIRPWWLLAILPLLFMNKKLNECRLEQSSWRKICDPMLLSALLVGNPEKDPKLPFVLLFTGWVLVVLVLAGPTWSTYPEMTFRQTGARIILLDMSKSMLAEDTKPNRFERAKHKVSDILGRIYTGETALCVFANHSYIVTPLTEDINNIKALLPSLSPDIMPSDGSRVSVALQQALEMLTSVKASSGKIILITDDDDGAEANSIASAIKISGYSLHILGVGTQQGGTIPDHDGGVFKYNNRTVNPALNSYSLRKLAISGGGDYAEITTDDSDIEFLLQHDRLPAMQNISKEKALRWQEKGPWLLFAVLPIALFSFRRGWLGMALLGFFPITADYSSALAFEFSDLWLNSNQQASIALSRGHADKAAKLFVQPEWRGVALYRAGKYEESSQVFASSPGEAGLFNQANSVAYTGELEAAIDLYSQIIKRNPEHEDAIYNKRVLEDYLKNNTKNQSSSGAGGKKGKQGSTKKPDKNKSKGSAKSKQQKESDKKKKGQSAQKKSSKKPNKPKTAQEMMTKQWIEHIPDDPGSLLKRKFLSQSQQKIDGSESGINPW
jgi:Ca-activated chloride channel homolog